MKKALLLISIFVWATFRAFAFNYEEARNYAWFLTDKMAYELNLTPEQYDKAYQINLEYLLGIDQASDCYGHYWHYRDIDLRCILFDWQYNLFATLDYFYRPVRWVRSRWHYPVYDHYRRGHFYFGRPVIYLSYRGGTWHHRGRHDRSPFHGVEMRPGNGMRDRYHSHRSGSHDYRPVYGRPSGNKGKGGHQPPHGDKKRPGGEAGRPSQPVHSNRPSQPQSQSRPSTGNYRPSREQGRGQVRREGRDVSRSSREGTAGRGETGKRSFGR